MHLRRIVFAHQFGCTPWMKFRASFVGRLRRVIKRLCHMSINSRDFLPFQLSYEFFNEEKRLLLLWPLLWPWILLLGV